MAACTDTHRLPSERREAASGSQQAYLIHEHSTFEYKDLNMRFFFLLDFIKFRQKFNLHKKHCQRHNGPSLYNLNHFSDENQFEGDVYCIGSKFGHQVALFALVVNLASR